MNIKEEIQQHYLITDGTDQSINKLLDVVANLIVLNRLVQQESILSNFKESDVSTDSPLDSVDYLSKSKQYYDSIIELHSSFKFHVSVKLILERVFKILKDENPLQKSRAFLYASKLNQKKFCVLSFTSVTQSKKDIIENVSDITSKTQYEIELLQDEDLYVAEIKNCDTDKTFYISNLSCEYEDVFEIWFANRELQIKFYVAMEDRKTVYRVEVLNQANISLINFQ